MEFLLIVGIVLKNVNKDMEETMSKVESSTCRIIFNSSVY